jgi:hypothetical protein
MMAYAERMEFSFSDKDRLDKHPGGLNDREGDEPDDGSRPNHQRIADLEAEQHGKADDRDQRGQQVADGDLSQQNASAEDRTDRGSECALHKTLNIRVVAVPQQNGRDDQHHQERR